MGAVGGFGQGKLRRKDGGRESGLESWSLEWVLRREVLRVGFSGSGWLMPDGVGSGHVVGVGSSKIVLRRLGCVPERLCELGFRVGVSTSESGLL